MHLWNTVCIDRVIAWRSLCEDSGSWSPSELQKTFSKYGSSQGIIIEMYSEVRSKKMQQYTTIWGKGTERAKETAQVYTRWQSGKINIWAGSWVQNEEEKEIAELCPNE